MTRFVRSYLPALLAGALLTAAAFGQAAKPDLSTPKAAAKTFMTAIAAGDVAGAHAAAVYSKDTEKDAVEAITTLMGNMRKFAAAMTAKYGDAAKPIAEGLASGSKGMEAEMKKIDDGKEEITGDTASVTGPEEPMKFKKVGSDWKVNMAEAKKMPPAEEIAKMKKMGTAMATITADVNAGKYASVEAAAAAFAQALQQP